MEDELIEGLTPRYLLEAEAPEGPSDKLDLHVLNQATRLEEALEAAEDARRKVRRDPGLNESGRRDRLRQIDEETAKQVRRIADETPVEDLEDQLEDLEEGVMALRPRLNPEDPEQAGDMAFKAEETRKLLRDLDPNERNAVLMKAAEEDDRVTLMAFEDAPEAFPLVPEDELEMARETHVQVRFPERHARIEQLRSTVGLLKRNANRAMLELADASGRDEFKVVPFGPSGGDHDVAGTPAEVEAEARAEAGTE